MNIFRHNLGYKLMALAIAVVLVVYVKGERNPQSSKSFTVPLEVQHVADGYAAEPQVREVIVKIQGPRTVVEGLGRADVVASVDVVGSGTDGKSIVNAKVEPKVSETEGDLRVTVEPAMVRVKLEPLGDKRLPVEIRYPSVPPLGFAYSNPVINPDSVSISGKVSDVTRVRKIILTLPSRVSGESIEGSFPVAAVDSRGVQVSGVKLDIDKVSLRLDLVEVPATKRVIVSPDISGTPAFPAKVSQVVVTPSLITLRGRPDALADVTTIDTDRISIDGATDTITRDAGLKLPDGVTVSGQKTVRVEVKISKTQLGEKF